MQLRSQDISMSYWDYRLLEILYKKQKIQREQIHIIVDNTINELLFELAQQSNFVTISCERNQKVVLETPMNFIPLAVIISSSNREVHLSTRTLSL